MNDLEPTGNPVFDYKAAHRRSSAALQKWLMLSGAAVLLTGLILAVALDQKLLWIGASASLCGLALFFGGAFWGLHWRKKLRADFRRDYGPKDVM